MNQKYKLSDVCFYIFWFFLQVGKAMGYTSDDSRFLILVACGLPFAIMKFLVTKWTNKDLLKLVALNLLGIATALSSGTTTYLLSIFCISAAKDVEIKKLLKISFWIRGPMFVLRTTLAILGYLDMEIAYRYEQGVVTGIRYGLGYDNPNTTQYELFAMIALLFLLYHKKIKIIHYIIAFVYNLFLFRYTDSRASFLVCVIFLVGTFLITTKLSNAFRNILQYWSKKSWIIGILFSIVGCVAYFYIPEFRLLGTFSSRFLTATKLFVEKNISLFGIPGVKTDLGFVYILYNGGLVIAVLFFWSINKLLSLKEVQNEAILQWAFSCLAIFNILEAYSFSILSNGLLLYLAYIIYPKMQTQSAKEYPRLRRLRKKIIPVNERG